MSKRFNFGREHRLTDRKDINRLSKSGRTIKSESFRLKFAKNDFGISRICFSISKKIATSPQRNRIKRMFREIFRTNKKKIPEGFDYLFIYNKEILSKSYRVLEDEFIKSVSDLEKLKR